MAWSRVLRCTVAILLALHVAAWQQDSWGWNLRNEDQVQAVAEHRSMGASLAQQALQGLKSLMPDAAAAAVLYGTEGNNAAADAATYNSPNLYESSEPIATADTASTSGEGAAGLGLVLPGSSKVQLSSSAQFDIVAHNKDDGDSTYAADDEAVADYTYLEEHSAAAAAIGGASVRPQLPPQLPEDMLDGSQLVEQPYARLSGPSGLTGREDQAAGLTRISAGDNFPTDVQIDGDVMVLSRLPVGHPLQQSIAQPVVALAADLARDVWQAVQQAEGVAVQQMQHHNPFRVQEVEIIVEETRGSSSDSMRPIPYEPFRMLSPSAADEGLSVTDSTDDSSSSSADSSLQPDQADMEISVTVESSRQRPCLPFLRRWSKKDPAAEDGKQAAALVSAVINALGMGSGEHGAASEQALQSEAERQRMQPMLQQLRTTGAFEGSFNNNNDHQSLSETTAAAVAAAATAMNEDPWDAMEMEVEVTHTTQNMTLTWCHILLLAGAMVITHVGLFLLVAPLYARYMARDGKEEEERDGGDMKQQFISAGLAEAGMYTKLLAEAA